MFASRRLLSPPLLVLAALTGPACGGAGGSKGPVDLDTLTGKGDSVCARAESLSCPVPNCASHNEAIIDSSQGPRWDCTAELAAYWDCLHRDLDCAWVADRTATPAACVGADTAYRDCMPGCSEMFFPGGGCSARCGGPPFAAECAPTATGLGCTCTYGPRIGRAFTAAVPSCDAGQWIDLARDVCAS